MQSIQGRVCAKKREMIIDAGEKVEADTSGEKRGYKDFNSSEIVKFV